MKRQGSMLCTSMDSRHPLKRYSTIWPAWLRTFAGSTALISLIDADRQWFKSSGMDVEETPRDVALFPCYSPLRCLLSGMLPRMTALLIPYIAEPKIRFYAVRPITPDGMLGTLCLIDYMPRNFAFKQQSPGDFGTPVKTELRRKLAELTALKSSQVKSSDRTGGSSSMSKFFSCAYACWMRWKLQTGDSCVGNCPRYCRLNKTLLQQA